MFFTPDKRRQELLNSVATAIPHTLDRVNKNTDAAGFVMLV